MEQPSFQQILTMAVNIFMIFGHRPFHQPICNESFHIGFKTIYLKWRRQKTEDTKENQFTTKFQESIKSGQTLSSIAILLQRMCLKLISCMYYLSL